MPCDITNSLERKTSNIDNIEKLNVPMNAYTHPRNLVEQGVRRTVNALNCW